eukprot:TRINITY_DN22041_c0_g1_i1.p2 TRINITY_DN22041_c0_g1~~TRINITY_DN22041_c0_g1_i1.p2  ORF type:complete len:108 (+),score=16.62 TRINITY_DN22041_c0_g1_i1:386-709(+)
MQKCSSHVVERCIEYFGVEGVALEILKSDKLHKLAQHEHGNYIVQRILEAAKGKNIYRDLMTAIERFLPSLQCHPYGSNVYYLIRKQDSTIGAPCRHQEDRAIIEIV